MSEIATNAAVEGELRLTPAPQQVQELLKGYVPEGKYCDELEISKRKARQDRQRGIGPSYVRIGRRVYYPREGILEWLKSLEHVPVRSGRKAA